MIQPKHVSSRSLFTTGFRLGLLSLLMYVSTGFAQQLPVEFYDQGPAPVNLKEVVNQIEYPTWAISAGFEGQVIVNVHVDEKGNYLNHEVLQSAHPYLEEKLIPYLSKIEFNPAVSNGKTVSSWMVIPFSFKLEEPYEKFQRVQREKKYLAVKE